MFYWEDYKSSGFDKSNLFLLRIANPQGRLAVVFLESLGVVFRQAFRRICNPASKNVLTYLGSADLQSAVKECAFPFVWGLQIPGFL